MRTTSIAFVIAAALAAACAAEEDPVVTTYRPVTIITPAGGEAGLAAREVFATRCAACHGAEGRGDGAAAGGLDPPPRNFHDAAWQQVVTDDQLVQVVAMGGSALGKSAAMPGHPDLKDDVLIALKDHIRTLGKTP